MSEQAQGLELIRIPAAALAAMQRVLESERGPFEAGRLLREIGLEAGDAFYELFRDWLSEAGAGAIEPQELDSDDFWKRLSEFFNQLGWGRLEHEQLHAGVMALSGSGWVEASGDSGSGVGCYFTTGMLAAILRRVAGRDLAALEVEPEFGGNGRFRILIGSSAALNTVFDQLQAGTPYPDAIAALA
jgi:predicted hydrocarbon binding protein